MVDRAEYVRKLQAEAAHARALAMMREKAKAAEPAAPVRKSGCSFCSHCRKKIKNAFLMIKDAIEG